MAMTAISTDGADCAEDELVLRSTVEAETVRLMAMLEDPAPDSGMLEVVTTTIRDLERKLAVFQEARRDGAL